MSTASAPSGPFRELDRGAISGEEYARQTLREAERVLRDATPPARSAPSPSSSSQSPSSPSSHEE